MLIVLILSGWFAFRNLALWLVVSDPLPQSLDAIFTFAGDVHRINYSKELYNRYPGAQWLLSYPSRRITVPLKRDGFDTSRIAVVDTCKNTHSEVRFITEWASRSAGNSRRFSKARPLSIGLVSTPFHMRRINLEVSRRGRSSACAFYYLPVPAGRFGLTEDDYKYWWKSDQLRPAIWLEFKKFIYYIFKYFPSSS